MTQPINVPTITADAEAELVEGDLATFAVVHADHPEAGEVTADARAWPALKADGWTKAPKKSKG